MNDEYISKQKAKDLMGCCLASAKAEYKAAKDVFTKARFGDCISAIQSMIDVVGTVEAADVQPVKYGKWDGYICSECNVCADYFISGDFYFDEKPNFCPNCGAKLCEVVK